MFNFIGFLFSLLKGIYNTCAIPTQVNRQASVARIRFAGFFGIFSSSINKILLDAQIKEYNTKISTIESSNPPTPTPSSAYTASITQSSTSTETPSSTHRAYRTFKRKFQNHPFPTKPGTYCE